MRGTDNESLTPSGSGKSDMQKKIDAMVAFASMKDRLVGISDIGSLMAMTLFRRTSSEAKIHYAIDDDCDMEQKRNKLMYSNQVGIVYSIEDRGSNVVLNVSPVRPLLKLLPKECTFFLDIDNMAKAATIEAECDAFDMRMVCIDVGGGHHICPTLFPAFQSLEALQEDVKGCTDKPVVIVEVSHEYASLIINPLTKRIQSSICSKEEYEKQFVEDIFKTVDEAANEACPGDELVIRKLHGIASAIMRSIESSRPGFIPVQFCVSRMCGEQILEMIQNGKKIYLPGKGENVFADKPMHELYQSLIKPGDDTEQAG